MREIKFRAWDIKYKRWADDSLTFAIGRLSESAEEKGYILEQFTSLLDSNGKEIYEGDIVKNKNGSFGEVFYDQEHWRFGYRNGWAHPIEGMPNPRKSEVIGNIHENQDLLK